MIKKADIILIIILIVIFIFTSIFFALNNSIGEKIAIEVDGKVFGTYDLLENKKITIKKDSHINEVIIKDGKVSMSKSNCPGKDCIKQGSKENMGDTIVCLPNKVIIEIQGGKGEFDSVSK